MIKNIKVQNFKTFDCLDLNLDNFNVLIGANASGKSSFIQIIKFYKDICTQGLDNAIALQGGVEYLRNINLGSVTPFSFEITFENLPSLISTYQSDVVDARVSKFTYKFELQFLKGRAYKIINDSADFHLSVTRSSNAKKEVSEHKTQDYHVEIKRKNQKLFFTDDIPDDDSIKEFVRDTPAYFLYKDKRLDHLLIEIPYFGFPMIQPNYLSRIGIYDFDSKLPKKAVPLSAKAELEYDGSNLAIVLKSLLNDAKKKKKFALLMNDVLPFVQSIKVDGLADKSFLFTIKEQYGSNTYLPASLISDGTIGIISLIIALYFNEKSKFVIIEEPERNIHPSLISKIITMMKDVSNNKQILITTHNVEVIKNVNTTDILLISRSQKGFSEVSKPQDKDHVKLFLQNELGIEDLFLQNLL